MNCYDKYNIAKYLVHSISHFYVTQTLAAIEITECFCHCNLRRYFENLQKKNCVNINASL